MNERTVEAVASQAAQSPNFRPVMNVVCERGRDRGG